MFTVIFEGTTKAGQQDTYLDAAAMLRPLLEKIDGFISIERFESLSQPGKLLSLSFWRDEQAVIQWRNLEGHRLAQQTGRQEVFADYTISVANVMRRYGMTDRAQAPQDSRTIHGH